MAREVVGLEGRVTSFCPRIFHGIFISVYKGIWKVPDLMGSSAQRTRDVQIALTRNIEGFGDVGPGACVWQFPFSLGEFARVYNKITEIDEQTSNTRRRRILQPVAQRIHAVYGNIRATWWACWPRKRTANTETKHNGTSFEE